MPKRSCPALDPARLARGLLCLALLGVAAAQVEPPGAQPANQPAGKSPHWAFQNPVRPAVPSVQHAERIYNDIDGFIEAALEEHGLSLGPEAERATLLRRVSLDLTGLPPTPAELAAFLADAAPDAYERMVERYLASPHYGERWGKYWLDAAGYADSNGYFSADSDRPLAYRYRDYVVHSLNEDKPYDRFVREQLAGDELAGYDPDGDLLPEQRELLIATHFLRNAPDGTGESDGNPDEVRTDRCTVLEGNLQNTMSCLLGITIQCCRCHDHKFEPITQQEYYRLQAIFYPVYCPDRWLKPNERVVTVGTRSERQERQRRIERHNRQIKALEGSLESVAGPLREQLAEERLKGVEAAKRGAVLKAFATPNDKRSAEDQALLKEFEEPLRISQDDVAKRFPEYAALGDSIRRAIAEREKERPPALEQIAALVESDPNPPAHHVLLRGQHNAPGPEVEPGVPSALSAPGDPFAIQSPAPGKATGRRSAWARWVTSPRNALFARVIVNRIWQHHFGAGLVATPDNLGQSGARPSHPALVDYMATELVARNWSLKAVHRLILSSAAYRQSSALGEDAFRVDPENRLLWRFPPRRLDAEAMRDAMLAVSGELDPRMGGPYVAARQTAEGSVEVDENVAGARRRSLYLQQRRTQVVTLLELFDAPSIVTNCTARNSSTVPLQSLALLNSAFALRRAAAFADRLARDAGPDADLRIHQAFLLACGRSPTTPEFAAAQGFLTRQRALYATESNGEPRAWTDFCQMLLASNPFLYVE
jgi:hypothetical protein